MKRGRRFTTNARQAHSPWPMRSAHQPFRLSGKKPALYQPQTPLNEPQAIFTGPPTCRSSHTHVCIHIYIYTCIHTYIHTYTYIYIYIHIYIYIYIYIHIYMSQPYPPRRAAETVPGAMRGPEPSEPRPSCAPSDSAFGTWPQPRWGAGLPYGLLI